MGRKIKAVIFDWAGTTVDYGCFAPVQAFSEVFKEFGVTPTMEEVRKPMGMLKIDHIRTMLKMDRIQTCWQEVYNRPSNEEDVQKMYAVYESKLLSVLDQYADPKPYVIDAIKELRDKNIKIGSTTGYTDKMMEIVTKQAEKNGYKPDTWFSPDSVNLKGRPYPYMIFQNIRALEIKSVENVLKVGDTISDIKEGKNAGVLTIGVIEGSSEMGLSKEEYKAMTKEEQEAKCDKVKTAFIEAGADDVILNMSELNTYIDNL